MIFELNRVVSADVLARRAGILFAGFAYLVISTAAHPRNATKDRINEAVSLLFLGLAILGAVEWMHGRVGFGVWIAISTEIVLAGLLVTARAVPQAEREGQ
ncbi:hypothetical protein K4L02_09620 [Phaeobacter inhibens]|uniref:hypothetical protein n=1 Tax=Phaeobacter inhibens TaxID=221822 RepID=UPI0021A464C8|nr:hypothetical protein [Phaeobacter inhibens]UWR63035.1 hypothetical protein K4L02_09620 [Phaeobacter inhibens]UWR98922.1 hypothetical protein K4L03_10835 [Phaeobacter inhibens]UWS02808.1 hypothetical protein K4K94_10795 [Phaeobacter inhibens]